MWKLHVRDVLFICIFALSLCRTDIMIKGEKCCLGSRISTCVCGDLWKKWTLCISHTADGTGGLRGLAWGNTSIRKPLRNREWWRSFSFCGAHRETAALVEQYGFFSLTCAHALSLSFSFEWKRKSMANQLDPRTINTPRHQGLLSWSHRLKNL